MSGRVPLRGIHSRENLAIESQQRSDKKVQSDIVKIGKWETYIRNIWQWVVNLDSIYKKITINESV